MILPLVTLPLLLVSPLLIFGARGYVIPKIVSVQSSRPDTYFHILEGYVAHEDIGLGYKVHNNESVTWTEAERNCIRGGARLAVIDSAKKLEYAMLEPLGNSPVRHVGIHRVDGEWVSTTNETISTSTIPWSEVGDMSRSNTFNYAMVGRPDVYNGLVTRDSDIYGDYICETPYATLQICYGPDPVYV